MKVPKIEKVVVPSPDQIKSDVRHLREWMSKEPHLPKIDDDEWLTTFLYHNKFSLETTKRKLDGYYSMRNKYPHIFKNRDPLSKELTETTKMCQAFVSKDLTKDTNARLLLLQFDPDPSAFDFIYTIRRISMSLDMLMLEKDRLNSYIIIMDGKNLHYRHFLRMLGDIATGSDIFNNAYTERIELINIINAPPFTDILVDNIKVFFPKKYSDRIFIHTTAKNNITEMVHVDALPSDYGGKGPSTKECEEWTLKKMAEYRDWYIEQDNVCTNEALRRRDTKQQEELRGSFRKLEVD